MSLFDDARQHPRLMQHVPITWAIEAQNLSGEGELFDVSLGGAMLQLTTAFVGNSGVTFMLASPVISFLPPRARLRWYRRLAGRRPLFLCGVVFLDQGIETKPFADWLAKGIARQKLDAAWNNRRRRA